MRWLDWVVLIAYLLWIVSSGLRASRRTNEIDGYFRANRSLPWWAVGLSVMATQLSAITLVGTTGKAYADGMRFVQFYFGLPIAMVILSITLVPFFYRANVYTAYEYLERRFDVKTRTLAAFTFLVQRALSCGLIIAAPSIILSIVLGWPFPLTVVIVLIVGLPVSTSQALHVAGAVGRLQAIDTSFNLHTDYTLWSGLIGSLFLMLSYFGCDQSQVQRYLTAKSIDSARHSLLVSAFAKIPLQAGILITGVLTFCFFLFNRNPMLFNPVYEGTVLSSPRAAEYRALEGDYERTFAARQAAAMSLAAAETDPSSSAYGAAKESFRNAQADVATVRAKAVSLVREVTGDRMYTDTNYVFPTFILTYLPIGLTGLMIAAILSAAMSASSGELNALATATAIDIYRRHINPTAPDAAFLRFSKMATAFWGLFACVGAYYSANLGSLIDTVNTIGSLFYGSLLGVFILAIGTKRANGHGAFWGLVSGLVVVFFIAFMPQTKSISYLWHNVIGAVVCVIVGILVSVAAPRSAPARPTA